RAPHGLCARLGESLDFHRRRAAGIRGCGGRDRGARSRWRARSPRGDAVRAALGLREAAGRVAPAAGRGAGGISRSGRPRRDGARPVRGREIGELTRIGVALGTERDLQALLDQILKQARRITTSDAGSLYLVETGEEGQKRLRFKHAETFSKPEASFVEFTIPVDRTSLAGYTAV